MNEQPDNKYQPSINEQVKQEFAHAEAEGSLPVDEVKDDSLDNSYILPSSEYSREDVDANNIDPDQIGEAFGIEDQRNEPLKTIDELERRDADPWELNPASADDPEVAQGDALDDEI